MINRNSGRKTAIKVLRRFLGIAVMMGAWVLAEWRLSQPVVPPSDVTDINSFSRWQRGANSFTVRTGTDQYFLAVGGFAGILPSGPAISVFDRSGRLLDWTPDSGDSLSFAVKWLSPSVDGCVTRMNRDELSQWMTPVNTDAR